MRMQEAEKDERRKSRAIFAVIFLFLEILKLIENRVRYIFAADGSYIYIYIYTHTHTYTQSLLITWACILITSLRSEALPGNSSKYQ